MDNARIVLERIYNYDKYDWSIHGFGFIRCYLDEARVYRLHVWDHNYRIEGASDIHNHPWSFHSTVIAGCMTNVLFQEVDEYVASTFRSHNKVTKQRILTGENAKTVLPPEEAFLLPMEETLYRQGSSYSMRFDEIHRTISSRGTITLIKRTFEEDTEHADVYFPRGEDWVDAKPRPATKAEVRDIMENAIANLFGGQA